MSFPFELGKSSWILQRPPEKTFFFFPFEPAVLFFFPLKFSLTTAPSSEGKSFFFP